MSTIEAYVGSFVGNDFVTQQIPKKIRAQKAKIRYDDPPENITHQEPAIYNEPAAAPMTDSVTEPTLLPIATSNEFTATYEHQRRFIPTIQLNTFLNYKKQLAITAVIITMAIVLFSGYFAAKTAITRTVLSTISFAEKSISATHHQSGANFVLPAHSILIHSSDLSNDLSDIEAQPITINLGTSIISPSPIAIQQWIRVSSPQQTAAKILTINTAAIADYLRSSIVADAQLPSMQTKNAALASINQVAKQVAKILFSCKGINLNISSLNSTS
jgi:hypothetical protein